MGRFYDQSSSDALFSKWKHTMPWKLEKDPRGCWFHPSLAKSGQTTSYTWDVAAGLPVVLKDNTYTYVYGLDLISATDCGGNQNYYLHNGLGSVANIVDYNGNEKALYFYDAFGNPRYAVELTSNVWRYTGEQRDVDSGLYYLRARYYDPATGRFLSQDPLPTGNLYVYVDNNPVNLIDPYGLLGFKDIKDAVTGGGNWIVDQATNKFDAGVHYGVNVYERPDTVIQESIGLAIAWTSFGDYEYDNGVGWWENCGGTCSWLKLVSQTKFAMGHNVFAEAEFLPCDKVHELTHVEQSDAYGPTWLPAYFWESRNHGYRHNKFEVEAYARQRLCEAGGGNDVKE